LFFCLFVFIFFVLSICTIKIPSYKFKKKKKKGAKNADDERSQMKEAVVFNPQFFLGGAHTGAPFHYHFDAVNVLVFGEKEWFLTKPEDSIYSVESPLKWIQRVEKKLESLLFNISTTTTTTTADRESESSNMRVKNLKKKRKSSSLRRSKSSSDGLAAALSLKHNLQQLKQSRGESHHKKDQENSKEDNIKEEEEDKELRYMSRIMRCTQRSGDVMLVPKMWGHATYNTQASIGVAFELKL
jgi:hypothetical protein